MKKILFCAGLVALGTSCTQDELLNESFAEQSKGITFSAVVPEPVESRGYMYEEGGKFPFFWYAEKDRINIYANGDVDGGDANTSDLGIVTSWASISTGAQYKATKSMANGDFTAINDENLIEFKDQDPTDEKAIEATFVATYNATLTAATAEEGVVNTLTLTVPTGKGIAAQNLQAADISDIAPMYSHSVNTQGETYNSVGERVNLRFYRPMAVAGYTAKGIDSEYKEIFGNLKTITLTAKGYDANGNGVYTDEGDIKPSNIAYADGDEIIVDLNATGDATKTKAVVSSPVDKIVATYNKSWGGENQEEVVFMAMANIDRSAYKAEGVAEGTEELMLVKYEFDNIYFVDSITSPNSWVSADNRVVPMPALDMADYPYLVVGASNPYTLIVNSGEFDAIYGDDETMTTIDWNGTDIDVTDITKVISKVAVNFEGLNKMTAVEELKLEVDTKIPAEGLKDLAALEVINLPAVTEVGAGAFDANLKEVYMPSYKFEDNAINTMLLKAASLEKLDMSAATVMNAGFPKKGLLLTGFTNLTDVTVGDGVKVGANAFQNCSSLVNVNGRVDIVGTNAFDGCQALTEITVSSKDIKDYTFNNCHNLAKVYYMDGETELVPNAVGDFAFYAANIIDLDLSETTTIGKCGFMWNNTMKGKTTINGKTVLVVGATSLAEGALNNLQAVEFVYLKNATTIGNNVLAGTTTLKEIKFGKVFSCPIDNPHVLTLGAAANIKLFVVPGQTGVNGNTLTIGNEGHTTSITFELITEEEAE